MRSRQRRKGGGGGATASFSSAHSTQLNSRLPFFFRRPSSFFPVSSFKISSLFSVVRELSSKKARFQTFLFQRVPRGSSLLSKSEAVFESRSAESGCQPQHLARLEEREEQDDDDDAAESQHRPVDHAPVDASARIVFRGRRGPHRSNANGIAPSAVALR